MKKIIMMCLFAILLVGCVANVSQETPGVQPQPQKVVETVEIVDDAPPPPGEIAGGCDPSVLPCAEV